MSFTQNEIELIEQIATKMDFVDFITLSLSAVSIGVAVVALVKSQRTQSRMLQIEQVRENDRQVEKQKANIKAHLEHLQKSGHYELTITNSGISEARDVKVMLNKKPLSDFSRIQPPIPSVPVIGPASSASYHWKISGEPDRPPFDLEITWSDDSGKPGFFRTTLPHPTTPKTTF